MLGEICRADGGRNEILTVRESRPWRGLRARDVLGVRGPDNGSVAGGVDFLRPRPVLAFYHCDSV